MLRGLMKTPFICFVAVSTALILHSTITHTQKQAKVDRDMPEPAQIVLGKNVYFRQWLNGITYSISHENWFPNAPQSFDLCIPNTGQCPGDGSEVKCTSLQFMLFGGLSPGPRNLSGWRDRLSAGSILRQTGERHVSYMTESASAGELPAGRRTYRHSGQPWPITTVVLDDVAPYILECNKWHAGMDAFCSLDFSLDDDRNTARTMFMVDKACHVPDVVRYAKEFLRQSVIDVRPLMASSQE